MRREPLVAQARREQEHLEVDRERAARLVARVEQMGKRGRIALGARGLRAAERRQRLGRDDRWRDGGAEPLGEERIYRLVFPSLDVARGSIVEQAEPGDVAFRLGNWDRRPELVAGADPDAELELVVEIARGSEARHGFRCRLALAVRAAHRGARGPDRGGAAMIADRHVFVVRQQRIVGAEKLAGIGGVVDAREEVGVVADRGGKLEPAILGAMDESRAQDFDAGAVAPVSVENLAEAAAQRAPRLAAEREQRIERRPGGGPRRLRGKTVEQLKLERRSEI